MSARRASARSNDTEAPANSYLAGASPIYGRPWSLAEDARGEPSSRLAPGPGLELVEIPTPAAVGPGDVSGRGAGHRHLRHRPAHRGLGRLGGQDGQPARGRSATSSPARWSRSAPASTDVHVGDVVSGEGHLVCGRCRNCRAGRRHLCIHTRGIGVQLDGAFAEYVAMPSSNAWVHRHPIELGRGGDLRPVRQRGAHGPGLSDAGRGRAGHRGRADRHHGRDGQQARRGPARGDHRPQRGPAGPGPVAGGQPRRERRARATGRRAARAGHARGLRRRPGDVGQPGRAARHDQPDDPRRPDRDARPAGRRDQHRLRHRGAEHADHQGHLRPGDVRDLVRHVGAAGERPGHLRRDHRPLPATPTTKQPSPPPGPGTAAR